MSAGLVRAGYWAILLEFPSPIDEIQHVAYIDTLTTEFRPPVIGHDHIPPSMTELAKQSPTFAMRSRPVPTDATHPGWGPVGQSYEGGQTPLGYAPFVPVWAVAQFLSPAWSLFALRLVAVVLAVLPLPLLVAAGRRVFPDRPEVGFLAAAVYLAVPASWVHGAIPAGDVLVPTAGLLALLALTTVVDRGADLRSAAHVGLATSGMLLVKPTTLGVVPLVLVAGLWLAWRRLPWRRWARWVGVAATATILPLLPWVLWNILAYGSPSAADANDLILGGAQFDVPFGWEALRLHTQTAMEGLFGLARIDRAWDAVNLRWLALLAVVTVGGSAVAWYRGRRGEALILPGLAVTIPAAFAGMLVVIFVIFGGRSSVVGRHLLVALPMGCLAIAAGAVTMLGRRLGTALLLVVAAVGLLPVEAGLVERFLDVTYFEHAPGDAALAEQDDLARAVGPVDDIDVDADCPVRIVDVVTDGPAEFTVRAPDGTVLSPEAHSSILRPSWVRFELPRATPEVELSVVGTAPELPVTRDGSAAVRAWCDSDDPKATTYAAMHDPQRPVAMPWSVVRASIWALRWGLPALALLGASVLVGRAWRLR